MAASSHGEFSRDKMEERRKLAFEDIKNGLGQTLLAEKYEVSSMTASRWIGAYKSRGVGGFKKRKAKGRPRFLSDAQLSELREILSESAKDHGFKGHGWTRKRVRATIQKRFKVEIGLEQAYRIKAKFFPQRLTKRPKPKTGQE